MKTRTKTEAPRLLTWFGVDGERRVNDPRTNQLLLAEPGLVQTSRHGLKSWQRPLDVFRDITRYTLCRASCEGVISNTRGAVLSRRRAVVDVIDARKVLQSLAVKWALELCESTAKKRHVTREASAVMQRWLRDEATSDERHALLDMLVKVDYRDWPQGRALATAMIPGGSTAAYVVARWFVVALAPEADRAREWTRLNAELSAALRR